jgi:hypothetical protein
MKGRPMIARALQIASLVLVSTIAFAQTDTIVTNAFPTALATSGDLRQHGFATGVLDGQSVIAAAYSNGVFGALLVLTPSGDVMASAWPDTLMGIMPQVLLRDIDGDSRPEIIVTMNQSRGLPATWIFGFVCGALTPLGPFRDPADAPETELGPIELIRIDASNRLGILDHHSARWTDDDGTEHTSASDTLFTLGANGFDKGASVDLVAPAYRGAQAPEAQVYTLTVPSAPAARTLLLVNGDADGGHRAASAVVSLNDHEVIGTKDLNETIAVVRVPITLPYTTNQVAVTVRADPGSEVTVLVLP